MHDQSRVRRHGARDALRILGAVALVAAGGGLCAAAEPVDEQFGSTEAPGGCCDTQACQQQAYKELERQRYEAAKRCVETRSKPCDIQPELKLVPLCPPKLQGKAESTKLEGGVRKDDTPGGDDPPIFVEEKPKLDPREKPPASQPPPDDTRVEPKVIGKILPPRAPTKTPPANTPTPAPKRKSTPPRTVPGDGLVRVPSVSASILKRQELPGDPAAGGTPSTPLTRGYFYSQGVMQGVFDSGPAAGESAMHLHVAAWYVLTGRPQMAQAELQLIPGTSVTLRGLSQDLDQWSRIAAGDPKDAAGSVQDAYDRGRLLGQQIGGKLLEKYGGAVLDPVGVPVVTEPPPVPGRPPPTDAVRKKSP